jgi:hypothetical protein
MSIREYLAEVNLKRGQIPIGYVIQSTAYFDNYLGELTSLKDVVRGLYNIPGYGILFCNEGKWITPDHIIWGEEE